ncbi:hypothetical protein BH11ARM2_BH11ARM2_06940 [soil metagenome]
MILAFQAATLDGVTFAESPGKLLAPLRKTFESLGLAVGFSDGRMTVDGKKLAANGPTLPDGTRLVPLRALAGWKIGVEWNAKDQKALLSRKGKEVYVRLGEKRVVIDKSRQELRAMQGGLMVLRSHVSTGRAGKATPNGDFHAGPYKAKMHRSTIYNAAEMPFSVQIEGNIFVHGYPSVPGYPASHGCIRLPIERAQFFYHWVQKGTPVKIEGRWAG